MPIFLLHLRSNSFGFCQMVLHSPLAHLFFLPPLQRDERQFCLSMPERESCFFVPVSNPLLHINQLVFQVNPHLPSLGLVVNTIWMFGNDLHAADGAGPGEKPPV